MTTVLTMTIDYDYWLLTIDYDDADCTGTNGDDNLDDNDVACSD